MKTITIGPWTVPLTKSGRVLILRTCNLAGRAHEGFQWPVTVGSLCEAPDWDPDPLIHCGSGLHGLLMGFGNTYYLGKNRTDMWMVVSAKPKEVVCSLTPNKVRFRRCRVVCVGKKKDAVRYLVDRGANWEVWHSLFLYSKRK